ncbi:hypothetical protein DMENIID0001_058860 [Sergentomyia squamirostris]
MKLVLCLVAMLALREAFGKMDIKVVHTWELEDKSLNTSIPASVVHDAKGDKLYLAVPRINEDIQDTLIELSKDDKKKSPKVKPFAGSPKKVLTSIYHTFIDECERLWVLDSGSIDNDKEMGKFPTQSVSIIAFNLKDRKNPEIYRSVIPNVKNPNYFGQFVVDVINPGGGCGQTYVYMPNDKDNTLYIHDVLARGSWSITNEKFKPENNALLQVFGKDLTYKSGIRVLALGNRDTDGHRTVYYIVGSGTKLWSISTKYLKYRSSLITPILIGDRGENTTALAMTYDPKTKVLFFAEPILNRISCWNTVGAFNDRNRDVVYQDKKPLSVTDFSVDEDGTLWFMSYVSSTKKREILKFWKKNKDQRIHIEVWKAETAKAVKGTKCV